MDITKRGLKVLLAASALELVLRVFLRTRDHLFGRVPVGSLLYSSLDLLSWLSLFLYDLSYGGVALMLLLLNYPKFAWVSRREGLFSFLILFLLVSNLVFLYQEPDPFHSLAYNLAAVSAILLPLIPSGSKGGRERAGEARLAVAQASWARRAMVTLLAGGYLCYFYFKLSNILFQEGLADPEGKTGLGGVEALSLGELLILLNGLVIFMAYGWPSFRGALFRWRMTQSLLLPSLLTLAFISACLVNSYMVPMLTIWSLGFTLYLPLPLYAVALFLFSFTAFDCLAQKRHIGYGLAFIFVAGYALALPYQTLLAVLGTSLIGLEGV